MADWWLRGGGVHLHQNTIVRVLADGSRWISCRGTKEPIQRDEIERILLEGICKIWVSECNHVVMHSRRCEAFTTVSVRSHPDETRLLQRRCTAFTPISVRTHMDNSRLLQRRGEAFTTVSVRSDLDETRLLRGWCEAVTSIRADTILSLICSIHETRLLQRRGETVTTISARTHIHKTNLLRGWCEAHTQTTLRKQWWVSDLTRKSSSHYGVVLDDLLKCIDQDIFEDSQGLVWACWSSHLRYS